MLSLYGDSIKISGIPCGMVSRGSVNGQYRVLFEREYATLEQIEAIPWASPVIQGECALPKGYGFQVRDIQYTHGNRSYTVTLEVKEQYLGDVAGYQAQVAKLQGTVTEQAAALQEQEATIESQTQSIAELEAAGSAAVLRESLEAAYEEGVESNG